MGSCWPTNFKIGCSNYFELDWMGVAWGILWCDDTFNTSCGWRVGHLWASAYSLDVPHRMSKWKHSNISKKPPLFNQKFSTTMSFVEYSWHQQCLQVEFLVMLVNNVKHVSTKGSFLKYFWHLRFFSWHIVKTLTSVKLFWMIKCNRGWMKYNLVCNYLFQLS